jgi:RNA exonuclease 1
MFSARGLFKGVQCPGGLTCQLPNCIFSHDHYKAHRESSTKRETTRDIDDGGDRKRVKLSHGSVVGVTPGPVGDSQKTPERKPFVGMLAPQSSLSTPAGSNPAQNREGSAALRSLARQVSPPNSAGRSKKSGSAALKPSVLGADKPVAAVLKEDLNPRLVGNGSNSAPHNTRLSLLRMLHAQMTRLDEGTRSSTDPKVRRLCNTPEYLIKLALDEEQHIAKTAGSNYRVTMGHTMVRYRKMDVPEWISIVESKTAPPEKPKPPSPFSTELDFELERMLLNRYIIKTEGLDKFGYILEPPTDEAIAKTQEAMEKSDFWETCDRCQTRFQIFHNRREDGALTSGTACRHHWGRANFNKDTKERNYTCCGAVSGSPGCSTHATHVFKTSDPTRLARALQFQRTPENDRIDSNTAVSFDCEMGYTTLGMEMIRVSATTWPDGKQLFDTLVRPIGHILDLNTRFSGVTPDQFLDAVNYTPPLDGTFSHSSMTTAVGGKEQILPSPAIARDLLFSFISPNTPLIGHSIDNDLNVMRIVHPTLVDTVILYPFPQGLPYRFGLKKLTKEHLLRDIQTAGAHGHDSLEDARATGDLVRAKLTKEWTLLKAQGWKIHSISQKRRFIAPDSWVEKGAGSAYLMPREEWWLESEEEDNNDDDWVKIESLLAVKKTRAK